MDGQCKLTQCRFNIIRLISLNYICSRLGVLKGNGCCCVECLPDITGLDREYSEIDLNAVVDPRIITNGIFASFEDALKCCDRLKITKLLKGNTIFSLSGLRQRTECSGCNSQFFMFSKVSESEWRLFTHETLERYIVHSCEGDIYCAKWEFNYTYL